MAKRYSVSALRDYQKCGKYYELSRIKKAPEDKTTHHRWAGSLVHAAFMIAYGVPTKLTGDWRTQWTVDNLGTIEDALDLFDLLWDGGGSQAVSARVSAAYDVLASELEPPPLSYFATGAVKALKDPNLGDRKAAWRAHYRKMLEESLEKGYAYPVKELEREVHYTLGGTEMRGFIDIVLDGPDGEIYVDLKTGYNAPQAKHLAFDDQMGSYYEARGPGGKRPSEIWYQHMRGDIHGIQRSSNLALLLGLAADDVRTNIESGHFPRRLTKDCADCDRLKSCIKDAKGKPVAAPLSLEVAALSLEEMI